jgi:hypothetical protein
MGNADVVLHVEANKTVGAIKVTVEKMRDGRDGFSIFFKVSPTGSAVPVPEKISDEDYRGLMGTTSVPPSNAQLMFNQRRDTLVEHGAVSFEGGLPEARFAELLVGERPGDNDKEALASWKTGVDREQTSLKNAHGKKGYKGMLCDNQIPAGGDKKQWRWFIVNPGPSDIRAGLNTPIDPGTLFPPGDHDGGMRTSAGASAAGYPS